MLEAVTRRFREVLPAGLDWVSLRYVEERSELLSVRRDVAQPPQRVADRGVMVTVVRGRGVGYAATSDLSGAGLREAVRRAAAVADRTAGRLVFEPATFAWPHPRGAWSTPVEVPWSSMSMAEKFAMLRERCASMAVDPRVVDRSASLWAIEVDSLLVTDQGGEVAQSTRMIAPDLGCVVAAGSVVQRRSLGGGRGVSQQGGLEVLDRIGFHTRGPGIAAEGLALLDAPECPTGAMHVLLAPDQMMLQIHESIGHPLELDRILGDERNYAGTSFVTLDMFGTYRYGSELLDVTFDPGVGGEFAGYGWDDDGTPAERQYLIRRGLLERPLGGALSQARAGSLGVALPGVANARASSWNRPPIDRMANLNVEPGEDDLAALIAKVERGVWMQTNVSWSIDDSRNKFQFGCEYGRLIEDGRLGAVVRNPNYRGVSATFWRNLVGVGDASTRDVLGTPFCGKGEPNQLIRVGHASPAALFAGVDVFGGH